MAHSPSSSTDSFKSFTSDTIPSTSQHNDTGPLSQPAPSPSTTASPPEHDYLARLDPSAESDLLNQSSTHKITGNAQFASKDFSSAVQTYDKALSCLPDYLDYEIAVLNANVAACHLKLQEWKLAVESATKAVDRLEALDPVPKIVKKKDKDSTGAVRGAENSKGGLEEDAGDVEEIDDDTEATLERLRQSDHTHDEVQRLRIKALLRRAKGRTELSTWGELQGAEEDYTLLLRMRELVGMDKQTAQREVRFLRPRLEAAKSKEMAEMMGKLKDMGNGLLKPFGLSTDMFNFVKDEKTGGYSMNMEKGGGGK